MRKLQTQDVFKMARIIKSANLKETMAEFVQEGMKIAKDTDFQNFANKQEEMGIRVFMSVIEACGEPKLESHVYDLLGGVFECPANEVQEMELNTLISLFKDFIKENDLVNFFKTAAKLV